MENKKKQKVLIYSIVVVLGFKNYEIFDWVIYLFILLVSCQSSLYILEINHLLDIWLANIFFHSVGCLFILLTVFFAVQKFLV